MWVFREIFGPFSLTTNFLFFFGREVVLDVECLADLVRGLPFDHVGHDFATEVEQTFDVEVVSSL